MASQQWFYVLNGKEKGPVSAGELRRLAVGGTIGADDQVWTEGMKAWLPAHKVKGRFPPAAAPASAAPAGKSKVNVPRAAVAQAVAESDDVNDPADALGAL